MKSIKSTQTEKNLMMTFAGESQARMRYTYWADIAKQEGYEQIAAIFLETANQESEHAKRMFKFLEGGDVEIQAAFPAGEIKTTLENLEEAAKGEEHEYKDLYPMCAEVAESEGFPAVAKMYRAIIVAEIFHGNRYRALLKNIKEESVFKKEAPIKWRCRKCGYVSEDNEAPKVCPSCLQAQAFFEIACENY